MYVFTSPDTADIDSVAFFVDDPAMTGTPFRIEDEAHYDLAGGDTAAADPYNTERLTDGEHTVTALVDLAGTTDDVTVSAMFTVDNHQIVFSTSADRSDPVPLEGAVVAGEVYVFAAPERPSVRRVDWYLDDPQMTGDPYQVELSAPWDFAGETGGLVNPFDTTGLPDGPHTITALIRRTDLPSTGYASLIWPHLGPL
jgi:hypothetical protein